MKDREVLVRKATGGMGTGSETRMYSPRSESSHMYRSNHDEEEGTYIPEDGRDRDKRYEERQRKREDEKNRKLKRKHIKIRPSDLPEDEEDEERDDSEKIDADREIHAQTGAAGNFGFLSSLANQARGPGASGGHAFAMSEPMNVGVRLLKTSPLRTETGSGKIGKPPKRTKKERDIEDRRASERAKIWRPSTGSFDLPPGGTLGPKQANPRRAASVSRAVKRGKKTGLMRSDLAVEMEHRGVAVKQPKSKDPGPYKEYLGQQESRRRLGGARSPTSSQFRYGARKYYAGKTGGGRLQGSEKTPVKVMNRKPIGLGTPRSGQAVAVGPKPRLKPHRISPILPSRGLTTPHLNAPQKSSSERSLMMMSEKVGVGSPLQKKMFTRYDVMELRQLINEARRALRQKDSKKKSTGNAEVTDADQTSTNTVSKPQGGTENAEADTIQGVKGVRGNTI